MDLKGVIRAIPDYPQPGILFRDITTLLSDRVAYRQAVDLLCATYREAGITKVAGIEARGFILGGAVAYELGAGFVPLRKTGKLPFRTHTADYELEYGRNEIEMHLDAIEDGEKVLLIDDVIATGGTALAGLKLLRFGGADIVGAAFLIDLPDLGGAQRVRDDGVAVTAVMSFGDDED